MNLGGIGEAFLGLAQKLSRRDLPPFPLLPGRQLWDSVPQAVGVVAAPCSTHVPIRVPTTSGSGRKPGWPLPSCAARASS